MTRTPTALIAAIDESLALTAVRTGFGHVLPILASVDDPPPQGSVTATIEWRRIDTADFAKRRVEPGELIVTLAASAGGDGTDLWDYRDLLTRTLVHWRGRLGLLRLAETSARRIGDASAPELEIRYEALRI